jgi:hypothetical protein
MTKLQPILLATISLFVIGSTPISASNMEAYEQYDKLHIVLRLSVEQPEELLVERFWNEANVEIKTVFEENEEWKAIVKGVYDNQQRTGIFPVNTTRSSYDHVDTDKYSQEILQGKVVVGGHDYPLENTLTSANHPYTLLETREEPENPITVLNQWNNYFVSRIYTRIDGSQYVERDEQPSYQMKAVVTTDSYHTRICVGHSRKKLIKLTHTMQHDIITNFIKTIYRKNLDGNESIVNQTNRQEITSAENNYQTCNPNPDLGEVCRG